MIGVWFEYVACTHVEHTNLIAEGNTVVVVSMWSGTSSTHGRAGADPTPFSAPQLRSCDVYFEYDQVVN